MHVQCIREVPGNGAVYQLVDDSGRAIAEVSDFLRHLGARGYSPNTLAAYAYDLLRYTRFLAEHGWDSADFTPARSLKLLEHLRQFQSQGHTRNLGPTLATDGGRIVKRLSPATTNRILAAVSSFYEYLIISGQWINENPLLKQFDYETSRVSNRHRPFISSASPQRPVRRLVRVRTVERVPRPMTEEQIEQLLASLRLWRDKAMVVLMLEGGLRPGRGAQSASRRHSVRPAADCYPLSDRPPKRSAH
jgi:site-specific recombinase XerD